MKADGLALGKGVVVAETADDAHRAIDEAMGGAFGAAGSRVVIEERLEGPELSIFALTDGERRAYFPPCRDHKRRYDGDLGPNTGGMGAFCPVPGIPRRCSSGSIARSWDRRSRACGRRGRRSKACSTQG